MINIPVYAMIGSVTALIVIGFTIGAYGAKFITRNEFKEAIDRIHIRMDEVLQRINDLGVKVAKLNGVKG